jgi:hypothetical protein
MAPSPSRSILAPAAVVAALCFAPPAHAQSAATPFHLIAANSDNSTNLKPRSGMVMGVQLAGLGSAPAYLKLYDKATAPTCGTDTPFKTLIIPAASTAANGGGSNVSVALGINFNKGLGICVVTGIADSDDTSVAASTFAINVDYE